MTEQDIGQAAAAWLAEQGYDVYHEVYPGGNGVGNRCADLVGLKQQGSETIVHVIECKVRYGIAVMDQGFYWINHQMANLVTVATEPPGRMNRYQWGRRRDTRLHVFNYLHAQTGIGWLLIDGKNDPEIMNTPRERDRCKWHQDTLIKSCNQHQQSGQFAQAGAKDGQRVTAFNLTARNLIDAVRADPGQRTRVYVERISHHYRHPRAAVSRLGECVRTGIIKGLHMAEDHVGAYLLYPDVIINEEEMQTEYRFIKFEAVATASDKPRKWQVISKAGEDLLGTVEWYNPWKKFIFHPSRNAVYDRSCLDDISAFMQQVLS